MELFNKAFKLINDQLLESNPWLLHAYGKAQAISDASGNGPGKFPGVSTDGFNYLSLAPNADMGAFSFFIVQDPQNIEAKPGGGSRISAMVSQVFWLDFGRVPGHLRNGEAIKSEILDFYTKRLRFRGDIKPLKFWENASNIYREYSLREIKDQFLMLPYYAVRLDLTVKIDSECLR